MESPATILDYTTKAAQASVSSGLRFFSKALVGATLFLIFAGSLVTSTGTGLSVPDWPTTYGHFMFSFPLKDMVGGIFYEHGHRMIASIVGMLTVILAIWAALKENRIWVRRLCYVALSLVVAQGLLGGITVLFYLPTAVSVGHAILAQTFFCLLLFVAYTLSKERRVRELAGQAQGMSRVMLKSAVCVVAAVYIQLILGALMRHTGSGLAIYDFPQMAGSWIPTFDNLMLGKINAWRFDVGLNSVNLWQVVIHFIHRAWAFVVFCTVANLVFRAAREARENQLVLVNVFAISFVTILQIVLGALTVLGQKNHLVASIHVITGALVLGVSLLLVFRVAPLSLVRSKK